jgi:hypothetical protein
MLSTSRLSTTDDSCNSNSSGSRNKDVPGNGAGVSRSKSEVSTTVASSQTIEERRFSDFLEFLKEKNTQSLCTLALEALKELSQKNIDDINLFINEGMNAEVDLTKVCEEEVKKDEVLYGLVQCKLSTQTEEGKDIISKSPYIINAAIVCRQLIALAKKIDLSIDLSRDEKIFLEYECIDMFFDYITHKDIDFLDEGKKENQAEALREAVKQAREEIKQAREKQAREEKESKSSVLFLVSLQVFTHKLYKVCCLAKYYLVRLYCLAMLCL